jgi:two-component system sensor histidine kinase TtrS
VENHKAGPTLIWNKRYSAFAQGRRFLRVIVALALISHGLATAQTTPGSDPAARVDGGPVVVGILAPRGEAHALARWQPTLAALDEAIPRAAFEPRALTLEGIAEAVAKGRIDFVLTNPGQFVLLGTPYALSWLATLRSNPADSAREALGSVLLVSEDAPYTSAQQLTGKRVVAVHEQAFGGYLLLLPQLESAGINPGELDLAFLGYPVDALLYQLRDGQAEAAIMPVCMLEQMAAEGLVALEDYRALMSNGKLGGCLASTPAYPDWTFAALPHVSEALAADVARVLLDMDGPGTTRWGAPVSAARVATLFDDLRLHPLQEPLLDRLGDTLQRYWHYTLFAVLLLLGGLLYHAWIQRQAHRHGRALQSTQLALRERERELASAQSLSVSGELAATLAHELNQPLAAIRHYAEGGRLRLERQAPDSPLLEPFSRIGREAARGAGIIEQARQWIRREPPEIERVPLNGLLRDAVALAEPRVRRLAIALDWKVRPADLTVRGNRLAMEQVLRNLINNSLDAFESDRRVGWIRIDAEYDAELAQVMIRVADNAGGFDAERLSQPFMPLDSSRAEGLGLGLVISRRLMQRQGGAIEIGNHARGGAEIRLTLPASTEDANP